MLRNKEFQYQQAVEKNRSLSEAIETVQVSGPNIIRM